MQSWSWMAALTLVASVFGASAPTARASEPPAVKQKVTLGLRLDGLSAAGGVVEIKPGHAGCKFETIKVDTLKHRNVISGVYYLDPIEVETLTADRDCSFSITLKEAGQPDKTVKRTLRLVAPVEGKPAKAQDLTCYISSNSLKPKVVAEKAMKASEKPGEKAVVAEKAEKPGDEPKRKK